MKNGRRLSRLAVLFFLNEMLLCGFGFRSKEFVEAQTRQSGAGERADDEDPDFFDRLINAIGHREESGAD